VTSLARSLILLLVIAAGLGGCAAVDELAATLPLGPSAPLRPPFDAPPPGSVPERVSPLHDRRGLHPGLTVVPAGERVAARALIAEIPAGPPGSPRGYQREEDFGPPWSDDVDITWGHDGCPTREEILHRDLRAIEFRAGTGGCVVLTGSLQEPYVGRFVEFTKAHPMEVQIDHVVPLAYAWAQGARHWSAGRRRQLANDPLNLLAVDGAANQAKSADGPAAWVPRNHEVRCAYAVRFAQVARRYRLAVSWRDRRAMGRLCGG
jgi:hypothetical protein